MVVSRSTLVIALSAALMACQAKESAVQEGAAATVAPQDEAPTGSAAPEKPAWTLRPTAQIQAEGNHLKGEGSVYLTQHAFNPLEWYPWGEEALERAIKEDKPIFLSIGYASCHWCHVMEHEVFEKEDVAAYMNEHFVNIKVDREERPDLDAIYMTAVQRLTGGGGQGGPDISDAHLAFVSRRVTVAGCVVPTLLELSTEIAQKHDRKVPFTGMVIPATVGEIHKEGVVQHGAARFGD